MEDVPEVAHHQRDIDFDRQMDQHPLPHKTDQSIGQADHAEHEDQCDQQIIQSVGQHLIHQDLVEHGGCNAEDRCDQRGKNCIEEKLFLRQQQINVALEHAALFHLAALELRGGVHQQQNARKVLVELIQTDLFQLCGGVADDDIVLALVLFAVLFVFLGRFRLLQHVLAALTLILDGGLFKDHHKVGQTLVGNDLCDTGQREIAEEIFTVHANRCGGKTQLVSGFLQTNKVRAFQVSAHHIAQAGDGNFLFVMEAHHCEAGSRTVGSVMLPDVGITHRCFL